MSAMHVELVSIEEAVWSGEAEGIYGRTVEGSIGILPGHAPLLGALEPGWPVRIDAEGGESISVAVHGGFVSVRKDGVSVLAEQAELADTIDVSRARDALQRSDEHGGPEEKAAWLRAATRLRAAGEQV